MSTPPSPYASGQPAVPPRRSGMTTAGKVLFFVGLALTVVAVIVGIWGLNRAIQDFSAMQDDTVAVQGTTSVPMDAGDVRFILAPQGTDPACTVSGPGGEDLAVTSDPTMDQAAAQEGVAVVGSFTATGSGEHTVTCDGAAELTPALGLSDAVGIGTAGLAFLALFPLGFITLLGLVLWLVGRGKDRKSAAGAGGYGYGASAGYPGYADQGYGAPGSGGYGPQGYGSPPPPDASSGTGSPYASPPPPPPPPASRPRPEDDDRRDGPA